MTDILQKYWIILIVLSFFIIVALSLLISSNHNTKKVPSKGVFVIQTISINKSDI